MSANGIADAQANALNAVALAGMQAGQDIANLEKPTRAELLIEVEKLKRENYDLREVIRVLCVEDDDVCPECGSEDFDSRRMRGDAYAGGDVDFKQCNECENQWGHA